MATKYFIVPIKQISQCNVFMISYIRFKAFQSSHIGDTTFFFFRIRVLLFEVCNSVSDLKNSFLNFLNGEYKIQIYF